MFFRPASSAQLGLCFSPLATSTYLAVLKPHMCGVKKEIGGPNRPHYAHDAGSSGAARCLKYNPRKRSKYTLWAVFVAVNTTSTYLVEASYVWCQEGNWGPKQVL